MSDMAKQPKMNEFLKGTEPKRKFLKAGRLCLNSSSKQYDDTKDSIVTTESQLQAYSRPKISQQKLRLQE